MSKTDYLVHKERLDRDEQAINDDLLYIHQELASIPEPASIELLQKFASEISDELLRGVDNLTTKRKRRILELLNIKVIIHLDNTVDLDGWLNIPEKTEGLLGSSSLSPEVRWWCQPPLQQ